jgi:hypothetical protein
MKINGGFQQKKKKKTKVKNKCIERKNARPTEFLIDLFFFSKNEKPSESVC